MKDIKIKKNLIIIFCLIFNCGVMLASNKNKTKTIRVIEKKSRKEILKKDVAWHATNIGCLDYDVQEAIKKECPDSISSSIKYAYDDIWKFDRPDMEDPIEIKLILTDIEYNDKPRVQNFLPLQIYQEQKQISVPLHAFFGASFIIIQEVQRVLDKQGEEKKIEILQPIHITKTSRNDWGYKNISQYKIVWIENEMVYIFRDEKNKTLLTTELETVVVKKTKQPSNQKTNEAEIEKENNIPIEKENNNKMLKIGGIVFVIAAIFVGYLFKTGKLTFGHSTKIT